MDINSILPQRVRLDEFMLESIGTVTVSTIALPPIWVDTKVKYETAILWEPQSEVDECHHIAWVGFSRAAAIAVHEAWCCPAELAHLIHAKLSGTRN